MKKKIIFISLMLVLNFLFVKNIFAEEFYYKNDNGVNLSKEEYDFLSDFYFEGYQKYMTMEDYDDFIISNIMNSNITVIEYEEPMSDISLFNESYSTANKSIKLAKSCPNNCYITITATWINDPKIRSYDLIGAYLNGTNYVGNFSSTLYYDNLSTKNSIETNIGKNGVSATFKLPSSGSYIKILQKFTVSNSGKIYASYQHAKKAISLSNSRKYSFSNGGYGNVFLFDSSVKDYYDAMGGVSITLS